MSPSTPPFSWAPLIPGLAVEGVDVEVGAERDPPVSLDPLPGEPDHLGNRGFEVVVAELPGGYPTEDVEGVHVPLEERLLPAAGRRPVDGLAAVGHAQRKQVAGDQLAAQPHRDLPEVDLTFAAGQVGLRENTSASPRPCSACIWGRRCLT